MTTLGVGKVVLHVADQQAAKDFWVERVGFVVAQDEQYGDERWIEVASSDGGVRLVLDRLAEARPARPASPELPTSDVMFETEDVQAAYAALRDRGVSFPQPPTEQPWGWWAMFEDPEGNRYALGARGA